MLVKRTWKSVACPSSGNRSTRTVDALQPGRRYEYRAGVEPYLPAPRSLRGSLPTGNTWAVFRMSVALRGHAAPPPTAFGDVFLQLGHLHLTWDC